MNRIGRNILGENRRAISRHQSKILSSRGDFKIGMQLGTRHRPVFIGRKDQQKLRGLQIGSCRKLPLREQGRVISQVTPAQIVIRTIWIKNLNPIAIVTIFVIQGGRVVCLKLRDHRSGDP